MATVQGVYLALFGRPADAGGLAYWNGVTKNGADLAAMLNVLPALPEYTGRFTNMTNEQIVNSIYQALFGRDAEPAGLAGFVAALANKTQTISSIAVNILDGAQGTDKARVDAKLAASDIFTAHLDLPAEQNAYNAATIQIAKDYINGVTESVPGTAALADAAIAKMLANPGGEPVPDDAGPNGSPVFSSGGVATVDEHTTGVTVYEAKATDDSSAVKYSLTGADAGKFTINETTGVVTIAVGADFETDATLNIGVRAQDSTGFASVKGVVVSVKDIVETATAGADVIAWASLSAGQNVNGLGGADTITGGSGNDTINGGDTVTLTNNPGSPGTLETITFSLGGDFNPQGQASRTIEVTVPGPNNDVTQNYNGNGEPNDVFAVAAALDAKLDAIDGYSATYTITNGVANFTVKADTVGDKANGFAVTNNNNNVTVNTTNGTAAVAPSVTASDLVVSVDTLTGGAGNDTFVIKASTINNTDWIKDFTAGDKIDVEGAGFVYRGQATGNQAFSITQVTEAVLSSVNFADDATEFATFTYGADRYLVVNADGNDTFNVGIDQLIKITGSSHTFVNADLI